MPTRTASRPDTWGEVRPRHHSRKCHLFAWRWRYNGHVSSSIAHCKGLLLEPVVQALVAERARVEPAVPEALRHYLDEAVYRGEWYPTADLIALLRVIIEVFGRGEPASRAFRYFGTVAAQRDLRGEQSLVPERMHTKKAGAFSGVIQPNQDLETLLRRAFGMWLVYHDAGEFVIERKGDGSMSVVQKGYPLVAEEHCFMITGYTHEVFRLAEIRCRFEKQTCRAHGDARCEWRLTYEDAVEAAPQRAVE